MRTRTEDEALAEAHRLIRRYSSSSEVAERAMSSRTARCRRAREELIDCTLTRENMEASRRARMLVALAALELHDEDFQEDGPDGE